MSEYDHPRPSLQSRIDAMLARSTPLSRVELAEHIPLLPTTTSSSSSTSTPSVISSSQAPRTLPPAPDYDDDDYSPVDLSTRRHSIPNLDVLVDSDDALVPSIGANLYVQTTDDPNSIRVYDPMLSSTTSESPPLLMAQSNTEEDRSITPVLPPTVSPLDRYPLIPDRYLNREGDTPPLLNANPADVIPPNTAASRSIRELSSAQTTGSSSSTNRTERPSAPPRGVSVGYIRPIRGVGRGNPPRQQQTPAPERVLGSSVSTENPGYQPAIGLTIGGIQMFPEGSLPAMPQHLANLFGDNTFWDRHEIQYKYTTRTRQYTPMATLMFVSIKTTQVTTRVVDKQVTESGNTRCERHTAQCSDYPNIRKPWYTMSHLYSMNLIVKNTNTIVYSTVLSNIKCEHGI